MPIDENRYERLRSIIKSRTGVDISCYSKSFIMRRLEFRMNACRIADCDEYLRLLERSDEIGIFASNLSINVTEFFRDPDVFAKFRELLRNTDNARIWSAGCASGEEPYTIAMIARDVGVRCSILASDISIDAIAYAKNGIYSCRSVRNVPKDVLARHFIKYGDSYQVKKEIRDMVTFEVRDITRSMPPGLFDFIFCRNMLIYMDHVSRERIISSMCRLLKNRGYLILGKSEYIGNSSMLLSCTDTRLKIYAKTAAESVAG